MIKKRFSLSLLAIALLGIAPVVVPFSSTSDPSYATADLPSTTSWDSGLVQMGRFVGKYSFSSDGYAKYSATSPDTISATLQVEKPDNSATVEAAYLVAVSKYSSALANPSSTTTLSDSAVTFTHNSGDSSGPKNWLADVTDIVAGDIDEVAAGTHSIGAEYEFDNTNASATGLALTVIFADPNAEAGTTLFQFGHAASDGETTTLNFSALPSAPSEALLSLGIGWSIQSNSSSTEVTTVDISTSSNGTRQRLTSYAGGYDDTDGVYGGSYSHLALLTVGGVGDDPSDSTGYPEDEYYDISGYLSTGDTSLTFETDNPSNNDTVFQLALSIPGVVATETVTFNNNGGTGSMASMTESEATTLTSHSLSKVDHVFAGWNTASDGSGDSYADGASFPFTASATLYAQWTPIYTVSYNANPDQHQDGDTSGSLPADVDVRSGSTHTVSGNTGSLTRVGFTFDGWNTASNGSGDDYAAGASLTVSADTTLYAQWGIPQAARLFGQEDNDGNRTETVVPVTGYSNSVTEGGFRGMTTDGSYLYYLPAVADKSVVLKVDFDGSVIAEKEVSNDSSNVLRGPTSRDLAYSSDCIFIRGGSSPSFPDLHCIDTSSSSWTFNTVTVPSPGFPDGQGWGTGSILDFPDGKIAVVSANGTTLGDEGEDYQGSANCPADSYCKVLRIFSVDDSGALVTLSHDQDILLADSESGWPVDNHGIASDGTYLFQSHHEFGYKTWALQPGVAYVAFNGDGNADGDGDGVSYRVTQGHNDNCGATTGVSGGFCPINPEVDVGSRNRPIVTRQMVNTTYFTRNHTTQQYLMGDYESDLSPRFLITEAATDQPESEFTQPAPTAPGSVAGSSANQAVRVSWSASTVSGGGSISYTVTSSPGDFSCSTASTSCQVTGLTNGTSYTFSVIATVGSVNSSAGVSSAVTPGAQSSGNSGSSDDEDETSPTMTPPALPGGATPTRGLPRLPTGPVPGLNPGLFNGPVMVPGGPTGLPTGTVTRFGGVPAPTSTSTTDNGVTVRSGGVNVGLRPSKPDSGGVEVNPETNQPEFRVSAGGTTRLSGGGLRPGSTVQIWLPGLMDRELGRVSVNGEGLFDGEVDIAHRAGEPPLPIGRRVMQVTGFDENGVETVIEMPLNIAQGPPIPEPNREVGALPDLGPSESIATSAGIPTGVVVTPFEQERSVAVDGGEWAVTVAMVDPSSEVSGVRNEAFIRMTQASTGEVLGTGFMPGTVASVWFFSEPTMMATGAVADDGSFSVEFLVSPQSIPAGDHTLQIQGIGEDGFIKAANLGVLVEAAPTGTTSSDASMLLWWTLAVVALLFAALIVWVFLRRRAQA